MKSYKELKTLNTFEERFNYLRLNGKVSELTFGGHRQLNQILYSSDEWKQIRRKIILRDNGCDLGIDDHPIYGKILIHHINPITIEDVINRSKCVFDLNNLICTADKTHNAIHYGDESFIKRNAYVTRTRDDTCPWK